MNALLRTFKSSLILLFLTSCASPHLQATESGQVSEAQGYLSFHVGNPQNISAKTTGGLLLAGGGSDVEEGMRWMIRKAGGGDFVVLTASGSGEYNSWLYEMGGLNSVETIRITSPQGASSPYVLNRVRNAEALFITGGDQGDYVKDWKGTPLIEIINQLGKTGVPIGGTSAGLAVLGQFVNVAYNGSTTSSEALANPYGAIVSLEKSFLSLPQMSQLITDSHFVTRDRMGRLITFMARILAEGWSTEIKGIGVDEETDVAVELDGSAVILGSGAAYFIKPLGPAQLCQNKSALKYENVPVYRILAGGTFNLSTWKGSGGLSYKLTAAEGTLVSSQQSQNVY